MSIDDLHVYMFLHEYYYIFQGYSIQYIVSFDNHWSYTWWWCWSGENLCKVAHVLNSAVALFCSTVLWFSCLLFTWGVWTWIFLKASFFVCLIDKVNKSNHVVPKLRWQFVKLSKMILLLLLGFFIEGRLVGKQWLGYLFFHSQLKCFVIQTLFHVNSSHHI